LLPTPQPVAVPAGKDAGSRRVRLLLAYAGVALAAIGGWSLASVDGIPAMAVAAGALLAGLALVTFALQSAAAPRAGTATLLTALGGELDRARRHRRHLALARLEPAAGVELLEPVLETIRTSIRGADQAWPDGSGVVVLMPDTDRAGAEATLERAQHLLRDVHRGGIVVFPEDGLTTGALLARLDSDRMPPVSMPGAIIDLPAIEDRSVADSKRPASEVG